MKNYMKEIRLSRKLTQKEVADKLFISQSTYNRIEIGSVSLTFDNAIKLTEIFNCSLNDIAGIKEDLNITRSDFEKIKNATKQIIEIIKKYHE